MPTKGSIETEPIVDPTSLRVIAADLGSDVAIEVATIFVDSLDSRVANIASATDAESLRRAVHALRTPAATVGAIPLASLCRGIEQAAATGRFGDDLDAQRNALCSLAASSGAEISRMLTDGELGSATPPVA